MRFTKFVQSGNTEQSDENGMSNYVYSFGASYGSRDFCILTDEGVSDHHWSINEEYATTFQLELIFENIDIPF